MMFTFALDYFIMVFVASLGVMQAAASIGGLRGLLLFKNPLVARPLGIAIAIAAIVWFFAGGERNINDYEGGLDSNEQALLFFLAVAASGILTCALTSLWNWRMTNSRSFNRHPHTSNRHSRAPSGRHSCPFPRHSCESGNPESEQACAPGTGLGALKNATWLQALSRNHRYIFNEETCWRTRIKRYFSG